MAKVKFGGAIADARGKIDGIVYSRNQFGAYVRNKVTPVNPQSSRQTVVRDRLTTLSKRWSGTLTPAQRAAWIGFAGVNPYVDVFGAKITLTGLAMYVAINGVLLNTGLTPMDTPPADLAVAGLNSCSIVASAAGGTVAITFDPTPLGASTALYIWGTQGLASGRGFFKPFYRYVGISADNQATPYAAGTDYVAKFGSMVQGQAIGFLVSVVNRLKGAVTPGLFVRVIVGA
jgi:hypothetical protein